MNLKKDRKAVLLLDTEIADLLGTNLVQELLGWQRSLSSAIISMIDLSGGVCDIEKSNEKEVTKRLTFLIKENIFLVIRLVLIDRALR